MTEQNMTEAGVIKDGPLAGNILRVITEEDIRNDEILYEALEKGELVHKFDRDELLKRVSPAEELPDGKSYNKVLVGLFLPDGELAAFLFVHLSKVEEKDGVIEDQNLSSSIVDVRDAPITVIDDPNLVTAYSVNRTSDKIKGAGSIIIPITLRALNGEEPIEGIPVLESLKAASTLSPLRTFRPWLDNMLETSGDGLFTAAERGTISELMKDHGVEAGSVAEGFQVLLDEHAKSFNASDKEKFGKIVEDLSVEYLLLAKSEAKDHLFVDNPVASVHWANGAALANVSFGNFTEPDASAAIMAAHRYDLPDGKNRADEYKAYGRITASNQLYERFRDRVTTKAKEEPFKSADDRHVHGDVPQTDTHVKGVWLGLVKSVEPAGISAER